MEKLTITSEFGSFRALINPSKYSETFTVKYIKNNTNTKVKTKVKLKGLEDQTYVFDFVLDSTGIVNNDTGADTASIKSQSGKSVKSQLDLFKKVVGLEKNKVTAPYLSLEWGELFLPSVKITTLKVDFTLYDPNGIALRAKLTATFTDAVDGDEQKATESREATTNTTVKAAPAASSLPAIAAAAYGSAALFATVASNNNLDSLMSVSAGTSLKL